MTTSMTIQQAAAATGLSVHTLRYYERNLWAVERVASAETSLRTVSSNITNLLNYANFLE